MKKTLIAILLIISVLLLSVTLFACKTDENNEGEDLVVTDEKLYVMNWGEYIGATTVKDFEAWYKQETGKSIKVTYSTQDTNEMMLTQVEKSGETIDLVCPSEYAIEKLLRAGLLKKIDKTKIATIGNVDPAFYGKVETEFAEIPVGGKVENMSNYFVPYMWGTLGILYNSDVIKQEEAEGAGYGLLWNNINKKELKKKILLKDSVRDTYVAGALYLKENDRLPEKYKTYSVEKLINTTDAELLAAVEAALIEQKKDLKEYEVDQGKGDMVKGSAYVNLAWSGDALYAIEEALENDINLEFFVPEVGGNIWFDGWVIPTTCQNYDAALKFIEYNCLPEVAIANALEIGYTCGINPEVLKANADVKAALTEEGFDVNEYFADEDRYPDMTNVNLGMMKDFGDSQSEVMAMWERVKATKTSSVLWIVLGSVAGALVIIVVLIVIIKKKKGAKGRVVVEGPDDDKKEDATFDVEV
ncbi:MAG TPA: extracellular solute-binding protein [Clostridia bacterium]|jgi:spermidine/putrescine transport system substrate-binding protein|nr:extracellular solute-binding protein [Clostridia bacterium]